MRLYEREKNQFSRYGKNFITPQTMSYIYLKPSLPPSLPSYARTQKGCHISCVIKSATPVKLIHKTIPASTKQENGENMGQDCSYTFTPSPHPLKRTKTDFLCWISQRKRCMNHCKLFPENAHFPF